MKLVLKEGVIYFVPYEGMLLVYVDEDVLREAVDSFVGIRFRSSVDYE